MTKWPSVAVSNPAGLSYTSVFILPANEIIIGVRVRRNPSHPK